jgi:ATP-dependent Clp protease ATP-binding subunit ClpB
MSARKIELQVKEDAVQHIAQVGYDPAFGARPIKRTVQSLVQSPIAKLMLEGNVKEGDTVKVSMGTEDLKFENVENSASSTEGKGS